MGEPKPLASLSAGLLARKGAARPAMRRAPLGSGPAPLGGTGYDDLGWNDMGYDVDPHQSAEPAHMVDLKPLLTGSLPAHNFDAEHASELDTEDGNLLPQTLQDEWAEAEREVSEPLPWPVAPVVPVAPLVPVAPVAPVVPVAPDFPAFAAEKPEIVRQQEELIDRVVAAPRPSIRKPVAAVRAPHTLRARDKAAFTLRLDAERHLRLRLASAVNNRSAQTILTELLDNYLSSLPEIDAMASRLPAAKPTRKSSNHGDLS